MIILSFDRRARGEEFLDDPDLKGPGLLDALRDLRWINRRLGGYRSLRRAIAPLVARRSGGTVRLLDLGTGLADAPAHLVRWADRRGVRIEARAVDRNPHVVEAARAWLDGHLVERLRGRVSVRTGSASDVLASGRVDVVTASLFLHHLTDADAAGLLAGMERAARAGIVVSDLHRHPIPYAAVWLGTRLTGASPITRHDGPLSVRRGFVREELEALAERAGISPVGIRRRWAYRWVLTTVSGPWTPGGAG